MSVDRLLLFVVAVVFLTGALVLLFLPVATIVAAAVAAVTLTSLLLLPPLPLLLEMVVAVTPLVCSPLEDTSSTAGSAVVVDVGIASSLLLLFENDTSKIFPNMRSEISSSPDDSSAALLVLTDQ